MRLVTRLLALALGIGFAVAGVVAAAEAVLALSGVEPWLVDAGRLAEALGTLSWSDQPVIAASAGAMLGGAGLLVVAVWPRREAVTVPGAEDDPDRSVTFVRGGLQRRLAAAARADRDVVDAHVRLRDSSTRVRLQILPGADPGAVAERVTESLEELGQQLGLREPLRIRSRARRADRRVA